MIRLSMYSCPGILAGRFAVDLFGYGAGVSGHGDEGFDGVDGLLKRLHDIDTAMHRVDRRSPEYARLAAELTGVSREIFFADDGPGTERIHRSDPVGDAIEAAARQESAA